MNNKIARKEHYRTRRKSQLTPFQLDLTGSGQESPSLFYSNTHEKLIELNKIADRDIEIPETNPFLPDRDGKQHCRRRDCLDRKFEAIKKLIVSPRKVDITLGQHSDSLERKKEPCIHSVRSFSKKASPEKDLLKEFKRLEEMRRQLRSRNYQNSSHASFKVNSSRAICKTAILNHSNDSNPEKTDRSSLYLEVKARISKRYNNMFKKFTEGVKQDLKSEGLFLKDICSARSFRRKDIPQ